MNSFVFLTIFSSVAMAACAFIVLYFLFIRNDNKLKNRSLGLLFLAIGLRISKSIFYYIFPDMSGLGIAFGFLGFAAIGPLAYLYFKYSYATVNRFKSKDLFHFVFSVIGFTIITISPNNAGLFYLLAKVSLGSYLVFIGYNYVFRKSLTIPHWHTSLFYGLIALLGVLIFQFLVGTMQSYAIGTALAAVVVYALFFYILKSPTLIKKTAATNLPKDLLDKIVNAIETDKIYTQPAITLAQFSEALDTPTYLVSKATKQLYNKSFPEVINSFRIQEITKKLADPNNGNDTVEDLAYDVGFNTASAFYSAFKKETAMTPRAYQKMAYEKTN